MIRSYINRIRSSAVIKNMMTLSLGTIFAQLINILLSPVLARIFSPDDYGVWGVFSSTALICSIFMTGRYEVAILRPKKDSNAAALVQLCLFISCSAIIVLTLGFIICRLFGLFADIKSDFFICLLLYLFFNSVSQIFSYYSNREEKYKKIASGSVARNGVQGVSRLAFGLGGVYKMGLIYGTILGVLSNALILTYPLNKTKQLFKRISWQKIKNQAIKYKRFPLFELPSSALNTLSTNIPLLLLALYFADEEIGYFSMAISLMFLPISFITTAQSQVYYKRTCVSNASEVASLTSKCFAANFIFGAVALTLFELFAGNIFSIFLGSRWATAGQYAACFAPWILFVVSFSPISTIFLLKDKQNLSFAFNLALLLTRLLSVIVGGVILQSMLWSMILYGIGGFLVWAVQGFCILKISGAYFNKQKITLLASILLAYIAIWIAKIITILN